MVEVENLGERVPFMGVGCEVYGVVVQGGLGIGAELKPSYYCQAVQNLQSLLDPLLESRCRGGRGR